MPVGYDLALVSDHGFERMDHVANLSLLLARSGVKDSVRSLGGLAVTSDSDVAALLRRTPYSVYWPNRQSNPISLLGRPLFDYEFSEAMILDPDSLEVLGRDSSSTRMVRQPQL